jgi:hypothetical protein
VWDQFSVNLLLYALSTFQERNCPFGANDGTLDKFRRIVDREPWSQAE